MTQHGISYRSACLLRDAIEHGHRFQMVGEILIYYEPRYGILMYRDGYGGQLYTERVWRGLKCSFQQTYDQIEWSGLRISETPIVLSLRGALRNFELDIYVNPDSMIE